MQPLSESLITPRLLARARLLASAPGESAYWRDLFAHAKALGQLLHAARQQLDTWHAIAPVDAALLRLWEWGLVLPEEITDGNLTRVARWYIDCLRQQRAPSHLTLIALDSLALATELSPTSSCDHLSWTER